MCSNLQHFHLDTKTSSWKPHLTLLSKANRPIRSAPAGDYEDVSSDTAAAGSPLAWQTLDPRGWNGKIWFLQEEPSVLRGVMRKRCLNCTGRYGTFAVLVFLMHFHTAAEVEIHVLLRSKAEMVSVNKLLRIFQFFLICSQAINEYTLF